MNHLKLARLGLLLCAGIAASLCSSCRSIFAAPPHVTHGGDRLGIVRLPKDFTRRLSGGSYSLCSEDEIRLAVAAGFESVMFRGRDVLNAPEFGQAADGSIVLTRDIEYAYSDNCYAVSLDGGFAPRDAAPGEWERGRKRRDDYDVRGAYDDMSIRQPDGSLCIWNRNGEEIVSYENPSADGFVRWRGREYKASGKELNSDALLSQDARRLAVFSHTSRRKLFKMPSLMPFLGGDDGIAGGMMFVDLYDASTGERIAAASLPHRGSMDMIVFSRAAWIGGRYFVMPTEFRASSYLLGIMPE